MTEVRGGIDLGGTKIEAVVVDAAGKVVSQSRHPTPTDGGPAKVADEMIAAISSAAEQAGIATEQLGGVGVGSPGEIDSRRGTVAHARNLPDWDAPFALGPSLEDSLSTRVKIGNDVQVAVEAVILGGGLGVRLGPRYLDAIRKEMMKHVFVPECPPKLHVARLGGMGGAIGASLLVANKRG